VCIYAVRQTHRPRISRKVAPEDKGATPPLGERARSLKAALLLVPHLCGAAFALPRPDALSLPVSRSLLRAHKPDDMSIPRQRS
jgi:hypothetical protein